MPPLPLGDYLLQSHRLERPSLLEALALQRREGGSLGTCLLETGALSEEELLTALAERSGTPAAPVRELLHPQVDAVEQLSAEFARSQKAVPFRLEGRRLHIAVADAGDLGRGDDLAFAAETPVTLWITSEVRLAQALERAYGESCPDRFRRLADRLDHSTPLEDRTDLPTGEASPAGTDELDLKAWTLPDLLMPTVLEVAAPPLLDEEEGTESSDDTLGDDTAGDATAAQTPPPQSAAASSGSAIGRAVLETLLQSWHRAAILAVRRGRVEGWLGGGENLQQERLANFEVALNAPSLFLSFAQGTEVYTGALTPMRPHRELMHCWNLELADSCAAAAVRVGNRLVAVLFAEGPRTPTVASPPRARDALRELGRDTGKAFQQLILEESPVSPVKP
ncbi:MAG: hypothetical protein AAGD01_03045 [Acidobacteriota bacterium]